ncbi:YihY/virulence factor BrkB family protein [Thalassobacillus sp. CUG 92003]|uniref:YihY/virulence factor BrkB family protein n=1 Tax=Thalassobacillus sp. CUG 92003 TaxID=2736641 RepID=UPI0015E76760|nr:YihY/virulence factor BrkB family protein [Thalassobacillus sp. CUG 92003]
MKPYIDFGKELFRRFSTDDVAGMAAQLAYFFLLSLFPFMIFLVTLLGYLQLSEENVLSFLQMYAPSETYSMIEENIQAVLNNKNTGLLSIGIIGTLWSASNGVNAIIRVFNRAYEVEEKRSLVAGRMVAIVLTIAMVMVIAIALLLPVFGKAIGVFLFSFIGVSEEFTQLWDALRWVISSLIFLIVLSFLYMTAPDLKVKFKDTIGGAIFATVCWQLVSLLFSFYVSNLGNFSGTYGSLGGVIVLMIWFYLSGIIIIVGGEINAILRRRRIGIQN